jgi:hypothetical protein
MTISRSFIAQLLERQVFHATYHKTYHGIGKSNDPLDPGRLANRVTREHKGTNPQTIQTGYQLVPKEGGKTWGPYWNIYRGNELLQKAALGEVWKVLTAEQKRIAEDLVFGHEG